MNALFILLSLLAIGGISPLHDQQAADGGNITIDERTVFDSQIRYYGHVNEENYPDESIVVDEQFADTKSMMESKYPEFKTSYLFQNRRTILGFDAPTLSSINRLTLRIRFKMYGKIDLFNINPKIREENFVIKAANRYQPYSYYSLHDDVSGAETKEAFTNNYTIPYIGSPSDIVTLENKLFAAHDLTGSNWGVKNSTSDFESVIDCPDWGDNFYSISRDPLKQKGYYVVLPCFFDITQAWISVAGVDTEGNDVSDGLDDDGNPFIDNTGIGLDFGYATVKYVDFAVNDVRAVYFTERATIISIMVDGIDVGGNENEPYLRFGDYDFKENRFNTMTKEFWLTDVGDYIQSPDNVFSVSAGQDAILSYIPVGDFQLRIYYVSEGLAVYRNILGSDGIETPVTSTGSSTTAYDQLDDVDSFWATFSLFFATIGILVGGTMIVYIVAKKRR